MKGSEAVLTQVHRLVATEPSAAVARRVAEVIRAAADYRWVGLYEVTDTEIAAVAWTGTDPPAHPRFPRAQGLCGGAVAAHAPVVVGDVAKDPRYLTTFSSTQSEIVVPVIDPAGRVLGLIDVESERLNAFSADDTEFLQHCAAALAPLFRDSLSEAKNQ